MDNKNNIPALRFPGFSGEWEEKTLGEICKIAEDKCDSDYLDISTYISTENMLQDYGGIRQAANLPSSGSYTQFSKGDVLFSNIRPYLKKVWQAEFDGTASNDVVVFHASEPYNSAFVSHVIKNSRFIEYSMVGAKGLKMPRGDKKQMMEYIFSIPSSPSEQQKIASFLSEVDALISAQSQKVDALKERKKGLMQQLFPQPGETVPRLRFPGFEGEWEEAPLSHFLFEHKTKSDGKCEVHSVSVSKGVINQVEYLGRSFAATDTSKYNLAKPNDIIYTKSPTGDFPYGIIKQNKNPYNVIVSPLYAVYTPASKYLGYMLDSYFESPTNTYNYLYSLIQKGAKNTIQISNDTFVSKKIRLPEDEKEQEKIASLLSSLDDLIASETAKADSLKAMKKGLMQQMFPQPAK